MCNGSGQCSISECYNYYSEEFCDEVLEEHDYFLLHCDYCQYAVDPCPEGYDCSGECGGSAVIDECGVCNGSGIADGACDCNGNIEDCAGVCGGFSWIDSCGVCVPSGSLYDGHEDCTGVCFGDSGWDECQVCNGPRAIYECGCYDIPEGACSCGGGEYQNDCGECEDFPCTCLPCTDPYSPMYIPDPLIPGDQQQVCGELGEPDICPNQLFTTEYICDIAPWRCVDGEFVSGQNGVWDVTDLDLDEYPWDEIHSYCNTLETCQHCHPIYSGFYAQGSWINFDNDDELVSPLEGLLSSALSGAEFAGDINKYPIIVKDNHPACSAELTPEISEYEISRVDVTLQLSDAFENDSLSSATNQVIFNNGISEYQGASMDTNSSNYELINEGRLLFRWDMIDASPELVEFGDYDVFANIKIKTIPNPDDLSNFETIYETDGFELCPRIEGHLKNLRYLNIGGDIVSAIQSQEINTFENYYFEVHIQVSLPNSNELISIFNKGSNYRLFVHDGSEEHSVGDNNLDGGFNVLDILVLVDCILNDSCFYVTTYFDGVPVPPYVLDTNGDGVHNVMDIVSLVICILAQNCGG